MHSSGSILKTFNERVRQYLDSADLDAKYTNAYFLRHFLGPAMIDVIARVSMMSNRQVVMRQTISLVVDQEYYVLPPSIQQVLRLAVFDSTTGLVTQEAMPRNEFNIRGPNWMVEGNMLAIRPWPTTAQDVEIFYIPSGQVNPMYGEAGILDATQLIFTLGTSTLGDIDRRENAYAGMYLRILDTSGGGGTIEERVIDSHDVSAGTVTVKKAFTDNLAASGYKFEIVPITMEAMLEAMACVGAMKAGVGAKISQSHMTEIKTQYRMAIKTAHDTASNTMARQGLSFDGETVDSSDLLVL